MKTLDIVVLSFIMFGAIPPSFAIDSGETNTPIKHLVIIFQENVSFDHYFGTYPNAENLTNEPKFISKNPTPLVNGLKDLLTNNPNALNTKNGSNAINPFRLARSQASTCDQNHSPGYEQLAFNGGKMDLFPYMVGVGSSSSCAKKYSWGKNEGLVMGYFDGNTVTAMWNYAQHFALSDNHFASVFGPSTPGALNLVAGNTYPATPSKNTNLVGAMNGGVGTLMGDLDPTGDKCSISSTTVKMGGKNIGDLLNAKNISWGAFMGGFDLTVTNSDSSTGCKRQSPGSAAYAGSVKDYVPHHAWFQYYASTANLNHIRPSVAPNQFGTSADKLTHHQYDIHDFFDALTANHLPAVSFIKAPAYQNGHAGNSDPLLEQEFIVNTVNALQQSEFWPDSAIIIAYDDSDGWYDHQMSEIINPSAVLNSQSTAYSDQLNGPGKCGGGTPLTDDQGKAIQGRCGFGPRLPLLVISPYAKRNYVDHTLTNQSSILQFIEDNWNTGRIGGGSFDALSGSLINMFDFGNDSAKPYALFLDAETGNPPTGIACLFNWGQLNYPNFIAPPTNLTQEISEYSFRYYPKTGTYLGVSKTNNHLNYLGANGAIADLGPVGNWLANAGCK